MRIGKLFLGPGEGSRQLYIDIAFYARPFSYATAFFFFNAAVGLALGLSGPAASRVVCPPWKRARARRAPPAATPSR
jgi:hypothetical protein